jgi:hypothetical protein
MADDENNTDEQEKQERQESQSARKLRESQDSRIKKPEDIDKEFRTHTQELEEGARRAEEASEDDDLGPTPYSTDADKGEEYPREGVTPDDKPSGSNT